jgi:hypothetical protein
MDFSQFPGAVLATTNCVLDPPKSYKDNLFTVNAVGGGGVGGGAPWGAGSGGKELDGGHWVEVTPHWLGLGCDPAG